MRTSRLAISLTLVVTGLVAPPQHASAEPLGLLCGLTDVVVDGDTHTGVIDGGPLSDPNVPAGDVYIGCTIQFGEDAATHAGEDDVQVWGWGIGAAVLQPTTVTYTPGGQTVYLCTEFWIDTGIGHETVLHDATNNTWPNSMDAGCAPAMNEAYGEEADLLVCPLLGGDVEGAWDCPPYSS